MNKKLPHSLHHSVWVLIERWQRGKGVISLCSSHRQNLFVWLRARQTAEHKWAFWWYLRARKSFFSLFYMPKLFFTTQMFQSSRAPSWAMTYQLGKVCIRFTLCSWPATLSVEKNRQQQKREYCLSEEILKSRRSLFHRPNILKLYENSFKLHLFNMVISQVLHQTIDQASCIQVCLNTMCLCVLWSGFYWL